VIQTATRDRSTLGPSVGWHAVVRAIGVPRPWWLYVPASRYDRKLDVRATPRPLSVGSSLAALGALASIALAGLRHRRRDLAAAALIGLLLCAALFADTAATPDVRVMAATLGYTMWWGSQVGMWVWLIPAWAAWLWVVPASRAVRRRLPAVRAAAAPAAASLLALVATVAVAAVVSAGERRDEHVALYRPIAALTASLDRRIPPARTLLLEGRLDLSGLPIKPALRYFLVRHGDRVLAPGSSRRLGSWYELDHHPYRYTIYVGDRITPPAMHFALADRVAYRDGWGRHVVTAWTSVLRRHGRRHPVPRGRRRSLSETSSRRPVTAGSRRSGRGGRRGSRGSAAGR
jgi:hypothetical protein